MCDGQREAEDGEGEADANHGGTSRSMYCQTDVNEQSAKCECEHAQLLGLFDQHSDVADAREQSQRRRWCAAIAKRSTPLLSASINRSDPPLTLQKQGENCAQLGSFSSDQSSADETSQILAMARARQSKH